jgi:hypothetical protein
MTDSITSGNLIEGNLMKKLILVLAFMLAGCADHSEKVQASYVSPLQYDDYSCSQIKAEIGRVGRRMNEVAGVQDKTASNDSAAMGVGLILFWPALFFIDNSDQHVELARLKGEFDALEQAAIKKDCTVAHEIEAIRAADAERRKALEVTREKNKTNN